jgi:RNA polymerase sigma-70 factor (ECF subfamily)
MRDESVKAAVLTIPLEDAGLVEQCRNGDLAAFGRLVTKYQDRVLNTCWRMSGSREAAEDLTQEAFVRAFEALGQFAGRSQFSTWVFRIAINLAISAKRKERGRRTSSLDDERGRLGDGTRASAAERLASLEPTPADCLLSKEREGRVLAALAEIDEESRTVVVLRDVEGLSYDEIAGILDVPVGTVKSRLHRARLALRGRLAGREETA